MKGIKSVSIVGTGNVADHLGSALLNQGIKIINVYGRNEIEAKRLAEKWNCTIATQLDTLNGDLLLVCVSDDAIDSIISALPNDSFIAFTSGTIDLNSLSRKTNVGVFYPLQTFTKDRELNFFEIPFLIESDSADFSQRLFDLAWKLSRKVLFADSAARKQYHLAAVWVNNFTNHMVYQAKKQLDKNNLNWELLNPLLNETVTKLAKMDPFTAQTGPARRGDLNTISSHEKLIDGIQKEMYQLISKSIIETYTDHD